MIFGEAYFLMREETLTAEAFLALDTVAHRLELVRTGRALAKLRQK